MKGAQGTLGIFRACYFDQENGNAFDADGDNRLDHFVYTSISTADCPCILPVSPSAQYSTAQSSSFAGGGPHGCSIRWEFNSRQVNYIKTLSMSHKLS